MSKKIYFQKEGMTSVLHEGKILAVTILSFFNQRVLSGNKLYVEVKNKLNKPQKVELQKLGQEATRGMIKSTDLDVGEVNIPFEIGSYIDVTSNSKGKGFAGVMKRWNFSGGRASHGASLSHRSGGSTGCRQDPGKTAKGKKMPGRLGNTQVTQQNLKILDITDIELENKTQKVLIVCGSVPGPKKQIIAVSKAIKRII